MVLVEYEDGAGRTFRYEDGNWSLDNGKGVRSLNNVAFYELGWGTTQLDLLRKKQLTLAHFLEGDSLEENAPDRAMIYLVGKVDGKTKVKEVGPLTKLEDLDSELVVLD